MVGFRSSRSMILRLPILVCAVLLMVTQSAAQQRSSAEPPNSPTRVMLPMVNAIVVKELAVADPATRNWSVQHEQGITLRLPRGWQPIPAEVGIAGRDTFSIAAPMCATRPDEGCTPTAEEPVLSLHVSVERADNPATGPGDEAFELLGQTGYQSLPVTIRGQAASLLLPSDAHPLSQALLVLHVQDVYYHIAFEQVFWNDADHRQLLGRILGTLDLSPSDAPASFSPLAASSQPASQAGQTNPAARSQATTSAVIPFSPTRAAAYALQYGPLSTNSNNCYIYTDPNGNNPTCGPIQGRVNQKRDGSQFIDCAMRAAGLTTARCQAGTTWDQRTFLRMNDLYDMLMDWQPQLIARSVEALPGDVLIVSDPTRACWGGIVVTKDPTTGRVRVAAHSTSDGQDLIDIDPDTMYCGNSTWLTARRVFLRLQPDVTPPTVRFLAPAPGVVRYGQRLPLEWIGDDGETGSVASYTLELARDGGGWADLLRDQPETTLAFLPDQPCQQITLRVTATDQAGLASTPATLEFQVLLQGDFDVDHTVGEPDLRILEQAWGMTSAQPEFDPVWDLNGDQRIDAADTLRLRLHQGDSCP